MKPAELWNRQLTHDPNPIGRIEAAQAVAARGTEAAVRLLESAFRKERFWGAQAEIARSIGRIGTDAALEALLRRTGARHPKARRAVIEALGEFRDGRVVGPLASMLADPSIHVRAESVRSAARSGSPATRKLIARAWKMDSWNDTIRAACVDAVAALEGRLAAIRPYLKAGRPLQVRLAAIRQIPRLAKGSPEGTKLLLDLSKDPSYFVRYNALAMLGKTGDPSAVADLQRLAKGHVNSRIRSTADRAARILRLGMAESAPKPEEVRRP